MAIARYFRLSVFGGWDIGSEWYSEQWQFGISLIANTDKSPPPRDVIRAPLPNCDVVESGATLSSTNFQGSVGFEGTAGNAFTLLSQGNFAEQALTFWNAVKPSIAAAQQMEGVKITAYSGNPNTGGPEVINGSTMAYLKTPVPGTGTFRLPPQCAGVMSLRTVGRGPGARGRFYVPLTGATLSTEGTIDATKRNTWLLAMQTWGTSLSAQGAHIAVVNPKAFTYSGVTQYAMGNHVDTQRRRARAVAEEYTVVSALG